MPYSIELGDFEDADEADRFMDVIISRCRGITEKNVLENYTIVEKVD